MNLLHFTSTFIWQLWVYISNIICETFTCIWLHICSSFLYAEYRFKIRIIDYLTPPFRHKPVLYNQWCELINCPGIRWASMIVAAVTLSPSTLVTQLTQLLIIIFGIYTRSSAVKIYIIRPKPGPVANYNCLGNNQEMFRPVPTDRTQALLRCCL